MFNLLNHQHLSTELQTINQFYLAEESSLVQALAEQVTFTDTQQKAIHQCASRLIEGARKTKSNKGGIDAFMRQYDLSSEEGIVLMCLAEALLRIPDKGTADKLIRDKLTQGNWKSHMGASSSLFVNAATWSLMLTGRIIKPETVQAGRLQKTFYQFLQKRSAPAIRTIVLQAMKILGKQFVMGETINEALERAKGPQKIGYRYSFDMLGEAAMTDTDAQFYFKEYLEAIEHVGAQNQGSVYTSSGVSVKLSALHPRYEINKLDLLFEELYPRLLQLCQKAKQYSINLTIDAEEADRLELSLLLLEKLCQEKELSDWQGLGLAVQAYQKRAPAVIAWLKETAHRYQRRFMVRLVKGAYWDSEIKHAQELGLPGYPVYTRKPYTDIAYIACAQALFEDQAAFYPQMATHNARTLACILEISKQTHNDFEFQCLHGMGDVLYDQLMKDENFNLPCRIYAPVGGHKHLLAYLVRRLLENGANSSFVNRLTDMKLPVEALIQSPEEKAQQFNFLPHPKIPQPRLLYGDTRLNASTINTSDTHELSKLATKLQSYAASNWQAEPLGAFVSTETLGEALPIINPTNKQALGHCITTSTKAIDSAFEHAKAGFQTWHKTSASHRATVLRTMADLLERHLEEFLHIAILEAGKSLANAIAEVREAIDFCRYYAEQGEKLFSTSHLLPGPTGETNELIYEGRGVIVCISPWNFPLAIFLGQVTASLMAGNAVLAKPAEQTSYIAYKAVQLLYEAGVPEDVLQLLPGTGEQVGAKLIAHPDVAGVIFTGSTQVAKLIQRALAEKDGPIAPLVAETGGQNAMIVDSSALPEQVTADVINSAFDSAGQRCSALRVLYVQEDVADTLITMLKGAMATLIVGDPQQLKTDVGPVIDAEAKAGLESHIEKMTQAAKLIYQTRIADSYQQQGYFVAPTAFEINHIDELKKEQFGPILHIIRYRSDQLDEVIDQINSTGYGLTFGIHSRIQDTIDHVTRRIKAGNLYVNRNTVGAVVGVQPFGGEGLSGTGPKAGGPNYLHRLVSERTLSVNTTASGGNASLMSLSE